MPRSDNDNIQMTISLGLGANETMYPQLQVPWRPVPDPPVPDWFPVLQVQLDQLCLGLIMTTSRSRSQDDQSPEQMLKFRWPWHLGHGLSCYLERHGEVSIPSSFTMVSCRVDLKVPQGTPEAQHWQASYPSRWSLYTSGPCPEVHSKWPGHVFCLLLRVNSGCAQSITGQVTSVTWPVIDWA